MLEYFKNITNLIFIVINVLIILFYIYIKTRKKISDNHYANTIAYVKYNLKYLISVFAKIRAGKTSFVNGVVLLKEKELEERCLKEMMDIIDFLPNVDFSVLNAVLDEICDNDDIFYKNWDKMTRNAFYVCDIKDGVINDFINCKSIYELIHKYIECYYVITRRGVYVYSKNWRYSFNSNKPSVYLSDNTLNIKDVALNKEFYLRNWSIVIEDELSLSRGNILSNSKIAKDTGKKELKALWGQIFEETVVYFSIKQRYEDEISSDRRLYTNYINLEDRKIYNDYTFFIKYFQFRKILIELKNKIKFFFKKKIRFKKYKEYINYESYRISIDSKIREKESIFNNAIRFFKSLAWVNIDITEYDRLEDIDKKELGTKHKLTLPLRDTIGNYDTHDYKFIRDILNQLSNVLYTKENSYFKSVETRINMSDFLFEHIKERR